MTGHLILIASYPKSGNTWVRLFLEALARAEPVSINDIGIGLYGFQRRRLFDSYAAASAADFLPDELEDHLPDFYAQIAREANGPVFLKVHDCARRTPDGRWLFPPQDVKAVLYLTRHPFDVAVSYAHHRNVALSQAICDLCDDNHVIAEPAGRLPLPLHERPRSWSGNVASWIGRTPYPVTHIRYEDLCSQPHDGFARLAAAAQLPGSGAFFVRALNATTFDRLRMQEAEQGFRERPSSSPAFFRAGRPGTWRGILTQDQRRRLVACNGALMRQLGYGTDGEVVAPVPHVSVS